MPQRGKRSHPGASPQGEGFLNPSTADAVPLPLGKGGSRRGKLGSAEGVAIFMNWRKEFCLIFILRNMAGVWYNKTKTIEFYFDRISSEQFETSTIVLITALVADF